MMSMKIVQFSRPPTPLFQLHLKFSHPLDLGRPISNEPPPPPPSPLLSLQMTTNQLKETHNPRMTIICYEGNSGRLLFSVSTH